MLLVTLRRLLTFFPTTQADHSLNPTNEGTEPNHDPDSVGMFKDLQEMEGVGPIIPVGDGHMYYAAMN